MSSRNVEKSRVKDKLKYIFLQQLFQLFTPHHTAAVIPVGRRLVGVW
jgi:hypothetical protein